MAALESGEGILGAFEGRMLDGWLTDLLVTVVLVTFVTVKAGAYFPLLI